MTVRIPVDHWSDPLCIWAYVAQPRMDALRERYGDQLAISYRVVPVFGSVPWRFEHGTWRDAGPAGRAEATARIAGRFGQHHVTGRVWVDDPPASTWSPSAAVKAVTLAEGAGEVRPGSTGRYLNALRARFFEDDVNIARREVQAEVARGLDLPWNVIAAALDDGRALAALFEDHQERERLGIQGSPTWVFDGGRAMLYGNVSDGVIRATIQELLAGAEPGQSRC